MPDTQKSLFSRLVKGSSDKQDRSLRSILKTITGYSPKNLQLFKLALIHSSAAEVNAHGVRESNERLEYLGDAVLGAVVAEYLFKKFPFKNEGFLTDIRSRIVNREKLNLVGRKIGLEKVIKWNKSINVPHKSIYGDTLEALIGALYLDRGYSYARKYVVNVLLEQYFDIGEIINTNPNAKSKLLEWAQKENHSVVFDIVEASGAPNKKEFVVEVTIDGKSGEKGFGKSKKKAEQDAAQKACEALNLF